MTHSSILLVGALALSATAFLIPGNSEAAVKAFEHPDLVRIQQQQDSQTIRLDCSTCPYALRSERNGLHEWTNDVASDLELTFNSDGQSLKFNGVPFFPISSPGLPPSLKAAQIKKDDQPSMEGLSSDLKLSYSLEYHAKEFKDSNSLVTVTMTIMGLDGTMIHVDDVEIKAIKDSEGKLTLSSVTTTHPPDDAPDAKCANVLCRVFTKIISGMNKAKASAKVAGHKMKCFCIKCLKHLPGHKHFMHPHHHGGLHHHGDPHRKGSADAIERPSGGDTPQPSRLFGFLHGFAHVMLTAVRVAFIPVLIGLAFGMAASAIGMLLGQLIVFVWMRYRGIDTTSYEPVASSEKEVPPPYEDVPRAEAMNEKEVEAKA